MTDCQVSGKASQRRQLRAEVRKAEGRVQTPKGLLWHLEEADVCSEQDGFSFFFFFNNYLFGCAGS